MRHAAVTGERCTPMAAELRLLGQVEALVDGQRLDTGHARQRCVLASLLVDFNRPVSVGGPVSYRSNRAG